MIGSVGLPDGTMRHTGRDKIPLDGEEARFVGDGKCDSACVWRKRRAGR